MKITTALTGFIVPKCKVYGNGFFSKEPNDPDLFGSEMNELRKSLYNPSIEAIKNDIDLIKNSKLKRFEKKDFEKRDGLIVIHRRYNILKNKDDNTVVIGSRNHNKLGYQRSYRNENGIYLNEDNLAIIKRRNKRPIENGLFKISKSNVSMNNPSDDKSLIHIHRKT